jgi:2'-5' RNA ligase
MGTCARRQFTEDGNVEISGSGFRKVQVADKQNRPGKITHMAFGIGITASDETGSRLREYWAKFSRFERAPSMLDLDHPPHVTLAVYDSIPERQVSEALRSVFGVHPPLRLKFHKLAFFETPDLVFWAAPEKSEHLLHAHAAIHELIDPCLCLSHYQPGVWVPHCTLATQVTAGATKRKQSR